MSLALGLAVGLAALATVVAVARLGHRWGFDPIDSFVFAIGGYIGYIIVTGLLLHLTPIGLSRVGFTVAATLAYLLAGAALRLDSRYGWSPGAEGRPLTLIQNVSRLGGRRALGCLVISLGALVAGVGFAHEQEQRELTPTSISAYVQRSGSHASLIVGNGSTEDHRVVVRIPDEEPVSLLIPSGSQWRSRMDRVDGYIGIEVTDETGTQRLWLHGLRPKPVGEMGERKPLVPSARRAN